MRKLFLAMLFSMAMTCAFAQNGPSLRLAADIGLPTGAAGDIYSTVLGGSLKFEFPVTPALSVIATTGVSSFIPKSQYSDYLTSATYIPVEGGVKVYMNRNFYLSGDLGTSFNVNSNYSSAKDAFIYAPGLGVSIPAKNRNAVDINLRYEGRVEDGGTISQVALSLGYKFGL